MSVISPHVYENETYEDYLDGQLSDEDIHYLEVSQGLVYSLPAGEPRPGIFTTFAGEPRSGIFTTWR